MIADYHLFMDDYRRRVPACRILTNLGEYQDSKHLHFHIASGDPYGKNMEM